MLSIKLVTILLALTPAVHPCRFANCVTNLAKMALVPKSTSVKYVIPIVTEFKTVPSTCFIAVNVTGDCRRRRAFTEKPIIISLDDEDAVDIDDILPTLPRSFSIHLYHLIRSWGNPWVHRNFELNNSVNAVEVNNVNFCELTILKSTQGLA